MRVVIKQVWKTIGPILLSAISLFITFNIIQPIAFWLNPTFNLLASRGIGKVAFISMVILQLLLFLITQSQTFLNRFLQTAVFFFKEKEWPKRFFFYFIVFFLLHSIALGFFYLLGYAQYNPDWGVLNLSLLLKLFWGFIVAFFLAWTEELIFRGMLYQYIVQHHSKIISVFATSLIFMLVHDLSNPLNLITKNWQLGLGLFLLGFLLNLVFIITGKLYTGMGLHAGLVFVKVVLRRARIITFLPASSLPFWISGDLRQSLLVHLFFVIAIISLVVFNRKKLF